MPMKPSIHHGVLLRAGRAALLAGSTSEAVAALSAALASACEFYMRVVCRDHGVGEDQVEAAWNDVRSNAERQAGAFIWLFLLDTGTAPSLDPAMALLQDRVTHQARAFRLSSALGPVDAAPTSPGPGPARQAGRGAREHEARAFGEYVFARIRAIEAALLRHRDAASVAETDAPPIGSMATFADYLRAP